MKIHIFILCLGTFVIGPCLAEEPKCGYGCMNGAQCVWPGYGEEFNCQCPEGFTGRFCETEIPNCDQGDMCYNGGTCKEEYGEYLCECPYPYTGYQCETEMKDCSTGESDSMCQNGGVCEYDGYGSHRCRCEPYFTGYQCETRIPMCETCSPRVQPCYEAPCECQGECAEPQPEPEQGTCLSCSGLYQSHCGKPTEESIASGSVELVTCPYGCHTQNGMYEGTWYVSRGCAEEMCWSGCNERGECTKCCYGDHCNAVPVDERPIVSASTSVIASGTSVIMAIAMGFLFHM